MIGLVLTVRDESDILRDNIAYHRSLGVSRFFIFFDRLHIGDWMHFRRYPDVELFLSGYHNVLALGGRGRLSPLLYHSNHMIRQLCHVRVARERAQEAGLSWLVNLDADELLASRLEAHCALNSAFRVSEDVDAVKFETLEAVATEWNCRRPFQQLSLFKRTTAGGEGARVPTAAAAWASRRVREGLRHLWGLRSQCDADDLLSDCAIPPLDEPLMLLPNGQGKWDAIDWFVGHAQGKQAVRVSSPAKFVDLHRTNAAKVQDAAPAWCLLHYNAFSFRKLLSKYRNFRHHPETYARGWPLDPLKRHLRDLAARSQWRGLARAYNDYVYYSPHRRAVVAAHWPDAMVEVSSVTDRTRHLLCDA